MAKTIIYQVFTRLFGNVKPTCKKNGTILDNGCGKFNDINDAALDGVAELGVTHVWYTGIIRHASVTRYPYQSHPANANVVKGHAGSPYAICDYFDVDPDLAVDVDARMDEFMSLVDRTHAHGMKVLIDFVPNHVARNYHSDVRPEEAAQIGEDDDPTKAYDVNNNFYYLPDKQFVSPVVNHDAPYIEFPAKASGNDAFTASPSMNDWYETVKLNYGVNPADGSHNFDPHPDTWYKMRDILLYWVQTGIDGFRVDMAEMVPTEFWRWIIMQVIARHPRIIFVAETYDINQYQNYIAAGFNLLYDKVNFYDTVRAVMRGEQPANNVSQIWRKTSDKGTKMLYFLENHDEQRIASDFFLGNPWKARPGFMLALLMGRGGTMIYFGQEIGERGMDEEGFSGRDGRTTIFDYWSLELFRKYVGDDHSYDMSRLPEEAQKLRIWYANLLQTIQQFESFGYGEMYDLMWVNQSIFVDASKIFAFLRYTEHERFLVAVNFGDNDVTTSIRVPEDAWHKMGSTWNECIQPRDMLGNAVTTYQTSVNIAQEKGIEMTIPANDGILLRI